MPAVRRLAAVAVAGVVLACSGGAAWAHVLIDPTVVRTKDFPTLVFRVPNERAGTELTKVQIFFPADDAIALPFVLVKPPPGWKWQVERGIPGRPLVVKSVTFSGGKTPRGQFELFGVETGPMPDGVDQLMFPTELTFSNGETARFDQPWPKGASEPPAGAPHVRIVGDDSTVVPADVAGARATGLLGLGVGGLGLLVGAAGLFLALRWRPRPAPVPDASHAPEPSDT